MDIRTGQTYETREAATAAGVPDTQETKDMLPKRDVPALIEALRIRAMALTGAEWERTATRDMMKEAAQALEDLQVVKLQETPRLRDWQPIKTAPKDGTPILGCKESWTHPYVFCYLDGPGLLEGWHDFNVSPTGRRPHDLTHWMPLPCVLVREGAEPT